MGDNAEPLEYHYMYHDTPIQKSGLSVRAFNCLNKSGFQIFEDVLRLTIEQLFEIPSMGIRSVWDILKSSYKFCCIKTSSLQINATISSSTQPPKPPLAVPLDAETVIKHLLTDKDTTSIAVHEAVETVTSQCKIKEVKARLSVASLPGFRSCWHTEQKLIFETIEDGLLSSRHNI